MSKAEELAARARAKANEIAAKTAGRSKGKANAAPGKPAEETSKRELSELEAAFKARADAEQRRFMLATDSEYWFAVCFQTRDQKEQFLRAMGLITLGDKYLDGWAVAKRLRVPLDRAEEVPYNTGKTDAKLNRLT